MAKSTMPALVRLALIAALSLPLAAFHAFVGWHKAFSPHAELVLHKAWTAHLPIALGKAVGLLELLLTVLLLAALLRPRLARLGMGVCAAFVIMEAVSLLTHQIMRDGAPALQNVLTIALTAFLGWLFSGRARSLVRSEQAA